jgi:hypothetical protein
MMTLLMCLIIAMSGFTQTFEAGVAIRNITRDPLIPVSGGVGVPSPVTIKKGGPFTRAASSTSGRVRKHIPSTVIHCSQIAVILHLDSQFPTHKE